MTDKIEKEIKRKVDRILSKYDLEGKELVPIKVLEELSDHFKNSMTSKMKEYEILQNQVIISERDIKKYLEQLEENKIQLTSQAKLAAIGEMAGNMSHEINTPLSIIKSHNEKIKLLLEILGVENEKLDSSLNEIDKTVEKISKIIKGLKRISFDSEKIDLSLINLYDVIQDNIILCSESLSNKNIDFQINFESNELFSYVNEVQFSQVFLNLIQNAKHAVEGLEDKERWIHINVERLNQFNNITISNGGPKIPIANVNKIFLPFFTTKDIGVGTGLGLSLSKKIIESFNGTISLNQSDGYPSFCITIPKK